MIPKKQQVGNGPSMEMYHSSGVGGIVSLRRSTNVHQESLTCMGFRGYSGMNSADRCTIAPLPMGWRCNNEQTALREDL